MRYFFSLVSATLILGIFSGCASGYSNVREDGDNETMFQELYVKLVKLCDGKSRSEHEACVSKINKEAFARYADRKNPQLTRAELFKQIESAVVYGAMAVVATDAISSAIDSSSSSSSASRSRPKACFTTSTQGSYAINTGGFIAVPVTCN